MAEVLILRLVHILGGIFWVGSGLFSMLFLTPVLSSAGPAAGPIMGALQKRRLFTALPVAALMTILSGLRLMWLTSGGVDPAYFGTGPGRTFGISAAAAVTGFLTALLISRPTAVRAGTLTRKLDAATDETARAGIAAELNRVKRRSSVSGKVATWLLVISAAGMAVARYVP